MANEEHLRILKQGPTAWNKWRDEHFGEDLELDLSGADLFGLDLQETCLATTNLSGANLGEARCYGASFSHANLAKSDLRSADLSHTDLSGANLAGADLSGDNTNLWKVVCNGTDRRGANLSKAKVNEAHISQGANLSGKDTNLSQANLSESYLCGANFAGANLMNANLQNASLSDDFGPVDLSGVNLQGADLYQAKLTRANLKGANLCQAFLVEANLNKADLTQVDLREARLVGANLVEAILDGAQLGGSFVYGVSVWKASLKETAQCNLIITPDNEPAITVDDLEVAQFIYLLLNNKKIRNAIDTITSKMVLILGRFTPERKTILEAIRTELRKRNLLPMLFDFEKPNHRDISETVSTLAQMARFVIADLTDAKSIPQELQLIVPNLTSVPVQPLLATWDGEYSMFPHFKKYHWLLPVHRYQDLRDLLASLSERVIAPAEAKLEELRHM